MLTDFRPYYWFPGPWTRVTSVVSLTTATTTTATAAMFPKFYVSKTHLLVVDLI